MNAPAPLYRDPIYDGAADPMVIRSEQDGNFYMFYTQRRANQNIGAVAYCYGCEIGVAVSENGGSYWYYRGSLDLNFEFGKNTFWAPEIIWDEASHVYHMFVSYIRGVHYNWYGHASIEHYTSPDLFNWTHLGKIDTESDCVIDPCLFYLGDKWRMFFKDEQKGGITCFADSIDLSHWEDRGEVSPNHEEGPNVFFFNNSYYLLSDCWDGFALYRSDDCEHFTRQSKNILREPGLRDEDHVIGGHADVLVNNGHAYIFYFTHPERVVEGSWTNSEYRFCRTSVQVAELFTDENGDIVCDRNRQVDIQLK